MIERRRAHFLPALLGLVLLVLAGAIGYLTKGDGAAPSAEQSVEASSAGTRGTVQSLNADTLILQTDAGSQQFMLHSDAPIEVLRPATAASIAVGDWLNVGGMNNSQTVFTLIGLTLIPQALLEDR